MGLFNRKREKKQPKPSVSPATAERAMKICREAGLHVQPMTTGDYLVNINGLQIVMSKAPNHLNLGTFFLAGEKSQHTNLYQSTSDWVLGHNNTNNGAVAYTTENPHEDTVRVFLHCDYRIIDGLELSDAQFRDELLYGLNEVSRAIYLFVEAKKSWEQTS